MSFSGDYNAARKDFTHAEETLALYQNDRWRLLAISDLGEVDLLTGRYQDARNRFTEALTVAETSKNQFGVVACQYRLGLLDHLSGQFQEAQNHYNQVLAHNIKPVLFSAYIKAAMLSLQMGQYEISKEQLSRGVQLCREILKGAVDYFDVKSHFALGLLLKGHEAEARALYGEMFAFCKLHCLGGAMDSIILDIALLEMLPDDRRPNLEATGLFYQVYSGKMNSKSLIFRSISGDAVITPKTSIAVVATVAVAVAVVAVLVLRFARS